MHDFFNPQPIKGKNNWIIYLFGKHWPIQPKAKASYMRSVLHDWTYDRCRMILQQLIPVMKKGYSKIPINENIVPDTEASWQITSLDWFMMILGASSERTETQ